LSFDLTASANINLRFDPSESQCPIRLCVVITMRSRIWFCTCGGWR